MSKVFWKKYQEWILENLPWIFILLGFAAFIGGFIPISYPWLSSGLKSIGSTILGSGIFAAVLKSFQFTGVFKKAVAQVLFSSDYLQKQDRKYLETTWSQVSEALFTNKFPKFKTEIEAAILNSYLPNDHNYYYENLQVSYNYLKYDTINNEPQISYEHSLSVTIVPLEKSGEFQWRTSYEGKDIVREIIEFTIAKDHESPTDFKPEIQAAILKGRNLYEKTLSCKCEHGYRLVKKEKRSRSLKDSSNNLLEFCLNKVTSGLTVSIPNYDHNKLEIHFVSRAIDDFRKLPSEVTGSINRGYTGVILPTQGFSIVLNKI